MRFSGRPAFGLENRETGRNEDEDEDDESGKEYRLN
jgi:hypothetical protein